MPVRGKTGEQRQQELEQSPAGEAFGSGALPKPHPAGAGPWLWCWLGAAALRAHHSEMFSAALSVLFLHRAAPKRAGDSQGQAAAAGCAFGRERAAPAAGTAASSATAAAGAGRICIGC